MHNLALGIGFKKAIAVTGLLMMKSMRPSDSRLEEAGLPAA